MADAAQPTAAQLAAEELIVRRGREVCIVLVVAIAVVVQRGRVVPFVIATAVTSVCVGLGDRKRLLWKRRRRLRGLGAVVVGILCVRGWLSWWSPFLLVAVIGLLPFGMSLLFSLAGVLSDERIVRADTMWLTYGWLRKPLRAVFTVAVWALVVVPLSGLHAAFPVLVPVAALAAGRLLLACSSFALVAVVTGPSRAWVPVLCLIAGQAVARLPPRLPRRSLMVPQNSRRWPLSVALRIFRVDRALRRSDWARADSLASQGVTSGASSDALRLRRGAALLELARPQAALDVLRPLFGTAKDEVRAAALRLGAQTLRLIDRPDEALELLHEASRVVSERSHEGARVALAQAEAFVALGDTTGTEDRARAAASVLIGRRDMVERLRACRLIAESRWKAGDLEGAGEWLKAAIGPLASVRWIRQYIDGRRHQHQLNAVYSSAAPLLLEIARHDFLEARIELAPMSDPSNHEGRNISDSVEHLFNSVELFGLLNSPIDSAEGHVVLGQLYLDADKPALALQSLLGALSDLDLVRHSLATQVDRARWSERVSSTIELALESAHRSADSTRVAELIELARVQAVPLLGPSSTDDVALAAPPTVRIRGRASVTRSARAYSQPIDLEDAAASASGDGAWWLSYWSTTSAHFCALVPASGDCSHVRIDGLPGSPLADALDRLRHALPIRLRDEDDADVDWRVAKGPLMSFDEEVSLMSELGALLLPAALRSELTTRARRDDPLPLAISPSPILGNVPWSLLVVNRSRSAPPSEIRLVECSAWALAPSASLLVRAHRTRTEVACPLRLAILDPVDLDPEFAALPAAADAARLLPETVKVLGGAHWHHRVATLNACLDALGQLPKNSSVLFGCHAVLGDSGRPSTSALVVAGEAGGPAFLTAADLFGAAERTFPNQVSLQACDTTDLVSSVGGEWLSLAPAFLAAGSRTVATTLFPLIDAGPTSNADSILQALIQGDDLAEATRAQQLRGLAAWRGGAALAENEMQNLPIYFGAFAMCTAGRGAAALTESGSVAVMFSARLLTTLAGAAKMARELRDRTVTSAHFAAVYCADDTEIIDSSITLPGAMLKTLRLMAATKLCRSRTRVDIGLSRAPSVEFISLLLEAASEARRTASRCEPEHVMRLILSRSSGPGAMALRLGRLHALPALRGAVATELRHAQQSDDVEWTTRNVDNRQFASKVAAHVSELLADEPARPESAAM